MLSVAEYEKRFTKFFKFAPELVITERKRIRRFIQGLNVKIQRSPIAAQITTFTDALDKAQRGENVKSQSKPFMLERGVIQSIPLEYPRGLPNPLRWEEGLEE